MRKLDKSEISCKVKQVTEKGCLILLYKTARVDAQILDETFGENNWTNDFKEIKGNLYCGIGVKKGGQEDFVWKWDCGVESSTEAEKGEASDAFKRAGFKWGIGVELYSAPFIWASVQTVKNQKGTWELKDRFTKFYVSGIAYDGDKIIELSIVNQKDELVFSMKNKKTHQEKPLQMITEEQFTTLQDLGVDMINLAKAFKVDNVKALTFEQAEAAILKKRNQIVKKDAENITAKSIEKEKEHEQHL